MRQLLVRCLPSNNADTEEFRVTVASFKKTESDEKPTVVLAWCLTRDILVAKEEPPRVE